MEDISISNLFLVNSLNAIDSVNIVSFGFVYLPVNINPSLHGPMDFIYLIYFIIPRIFQLVVKLPFWGRKQVKKVSNMSGQNSPFL